MELKICPYSTYHTICLCKICTIICICHPDNVEYRKISGWWK